MKERFRPSNLKMKKNKNEYELRSRFPWKRCFVATVIILLCAVMTVGLLVTIRDFTNIGDYNWIIILVWSLVFGGILVFYWNMQFIRFQKKRKDEK